MALKRPRRGLEISRRGTGFEKWGGYMDAKLQKLDQQYQEKADEDQESNTASKIFKGISIMVNGYTVPSAEELRSIMMMHGGKYCNYYEKVTHIIASNLPQVKIKRLKKEKILKPEWITESVKAGKLLPFTSYLLYNPGMLEGQTKIAFCASDSSELKEEPECTPTTLKNSELSGSELYGYDSPLRLSESEEDLENQTNSSNSYNKLCESKVIIHKTGASCEDSNNKASKFNESELEESKICVQEDIPKAVPNTYKLVDNKDIPKAGEANFISSYYGHSRLHHISSASNEFKELVKNLRQNHNGSFPGRKLLKDWKIHNGIVDHIDTPSEKNQLVYMHIDMDCFFVSVGLRDKPHLKGKPVAVTHARGKPKRPPNPHIQKEWDLYQKHSKRKAKTNDNMESVGEEEDESNEDVGSKESFGQDEFYSMAELASCNYEARKYGIRNGSLLGNAFKLCPDLQLVPFDFEAYTAVSKVLYETIASCTLEIESISCDEMFIELSDVLSATATSPMDFASFLRQKIFSDTGCPCSTGIGENILLARLATRRAKPNGQYQVLHSDVKQFIDEQLVKNLPGVGRTTSSRLESMDVVTCKDLCKIPLSSLQKEFGPTTGKTLFDHCRGIDHRKIQAEKERKSVSAEINYGMRFTNVGEPENFLKELAKEVEKRLKSINRKGKFITLKIKAKSKDAPTETAKYMGHGICDSLAKCAQLRISTDDAEIIAKEGIMLLKQMKVPPQDVRGMGIQVSKLDIESQANKSTMSVLDFMKARTKTTKCDIKDPNTSELTLQEPNKSKLVQNYVDSPTTSRNIGKTQNQSHLPNQYMPSPSQLDLSVLEALPEDIRKEILDAYTSPIKVVQKPSTSSSPKPNKPASRFEKVSPVAKSKRGRKKGSKNQPKKNLFEKTTKPLEDEESRDSIVEHVPVIEKKASLCGATELEEQKKLLKEWVHFSEPVDEDLDMFLAFISALINGSELEKLDLILKFLHRTIDNGDCHSGWKGAYNSLINNMQPLMIQRFDHSLRVKTFSVSA